MKRIKKSEGMRHIFEIALFFWILFVTATWVILSTYEQIGNSKTVPVWVKDKINYAGKHINKYVWRQYKYAE